MTRISHASHVCPLSALLLLAQRNTVRFPTDRYLYACLFCHSRFDQKVPSCTLIPIRFDAVDELVDVFHDDFCRLTRGKPGNIHTQLHRTPEGV
jgi:hypothetical protein